MKALFYLICLLAATKCLAMDFIAPKPEEILRAIGNIEKLSITLRRALNPGSDFSPLPAPKRGGWLAEHFEQGQTFNDSTKTTPSRPTKHRNKIYLQPLGKFIDGQSPSLEALKAYGAGYFGMDVLILPILPVSGSKLSMRINPFSRNRQLLTPRVLMFLKKTLPTDAFCILGVTMEDLYPHPSWNFVFGQASAQDRVGVFSFARYDSAFYGEERGENYQELLLHRSCKVLVHETTHMFSLAHCIFFNCVMNGSNHLQESDARPMHLCPVCLRKLQFSISFDVVDRYRKLLIFYQKVGFEQEARWVSNRLKRILGDGDR